MALQATSALNYFYLKSTAVQVNDIEIFMKTLTTDQQSMSSIFNRWRHQLNVVPQNNI